MVRNKSDSFCQCRWDPKTDKRIWCDYHSIKRKDQIEPKRPYYYQIPPKELLDHGESITDPCAKALYFFIYLTGARISEAVDFRLNHLTVKDNYYKVRMRVAKKRSSSVSERVVLIPRKKHAKCFEQKMFNYVLDYLKSFKSIDRPFRKWGKEHGKGHYMSSYLRKRIPTITIPAKVKNADGVWYEGTVTKPFHPHFLRHCRATHLHDYYRFTTIELRRFFEWSTDAMAASYTKGSSVMRAFGL